jgi:hypothetical protein
MPDRLISALTALTAPAADDYLPIVDVSEGAAASKNKRITVQELFTSIPNGSAAAPSIAFEGDPNTGFYRPAADTLAFVEGGVEAFRLASTGRIGINTAAPGELLEINNPNADTGLYIRSRGANNRKAHIFFLTLNSGGGTTGATIFHDGNGLAFNNTTNTTAEVLRIDSGGRTLIGTDTARATPSGISAFADLQLEGATNNTSAFSITNTAAGVSARAANIRTARIRGTATVVSTDTLGQWSFWGYDGTDFIEGAVIEGLVDGTPSTGVMPTYLRFGVSTTNTTAEQLRLTNTGTIARRQNAPVAVDTGPATLTIDNLKNGIITSTTAAAVTMTLPTGTLSAAGFTSIYTNLSFEWSVINTGPNAVTVQDGTAHTLVGSGTVAAGTSGRFQSRASAANTFISYRIA